MGSFGIQLVCTICFELGFNVTNLFLSTRLKKGSIQCRLASFKGLAEGAVAGETREETEPSGRKTDENKIAKKTMNLLLGVC